MQSILYSNSFLYEIAMRIRFGKEFFLRMQRISDILPENITILELCCGPALLYKYFLKSRNINYIGFDDNRYFVKVGLKLGADIRECFIDENTILPKSDYVIIQSSLYQFPLDKVYNIIDNVLLNCNNLIISESVKNWGNSNNIIIKKLGLYFTKSMNTVHYFRYTRQNLRELLCNKYNAKLLHSDDSCIEDLYIIKKSL